MNSQQKYYETETGFVPCQRIAIVCEYKREFLEYVRNNPDDKKLYFHVHDKESTAGYHFDNYIILDNRIRRFVDIVDQVRSSIR